MRIQREDDRVHTPDELRTMIEKMTKASNVFYAAAIQIGAHAFIEFTGLQNEYIKVCEAALARGQDFTLANTHTGKPLPMKPWHVLYLAEKLNCIYGPALGDPELGRAFVSAVLHDDDVVAGELDRKALRRIRGLLRKDDGEVPEPGDVAKALAIVETLLGASQERAPRAAYQDERS